MNCTPCHGDRGDGQGLVTKSGFVPIPLTLPTTLAMKDGHIYAMIRNGKNMMPSYNRIEWSDRWDVVNYVRGLQGKLGREVPMGPLGTPGETGSKVPGATMIAPERAVPHFPPSKIGGGR
jgi:mono/diheme cytochrome c family protein